MSHLEFITAPTVVASIISSIIVRERRLAVAVAALVIAIGMVSYAAAHETGQYDTVAQATCRM